MKKAFQFTAIALLSLVTACGVNDLPSQKANPDIAFSFNGKWQLTFTSEGSALNGSIVTVDQDAGRANLVSISNNSYCIEGNPALWQNIQYVEPGAYVTNALTTACNDSLVYNVATIEVIDTDEIRLVGKTAAGTDLLQRWRRVRVKGLSVD